MNIIMKNISNSLINKMKTIAKDIEIGIKLLIKFIIIQVFKILNFTDFTL